MRKLILLILVGLLAGCGSDKSASIPDDAPTAISDLMMVQRAFPVGFNEGTIYQVVSFRFTDPHDDLIQVVQTVFNEEGEITKTTARPITYSGASPFISWEDLDTKTAGTFLLEVYTIDSRGNMSNKLSLTYTVY